MITNQEIIISSSQQKINTLVQIVTNKLQSPHTKDAYGRSLTHFLKWALVRQTSFDRDAVATWRNELSEQYAPATVNQALTAVKQLAREMGYLGKLPLPQVEGITAVKSVPSQGRRLGNWLSQEQALKLLKTPNGGKLSSSRDRAILALMLVVGLRRSEVANLEFEHLQQRNGEWLIVDLVGKHGRSRSIIIPEWVHGLIMKWQVHAQIEKRGRIFRPIRKNGNVYGTHISPQTVYNIVKRCSKQASLALAPHDLRRTAAELMSQNGVSLREIQRILGHSSVTITERYMSKEMNFENPGTKSVPLEV